MAEELGLGVVPWGPLAQGVLTGKYNGFTPEGAQEALKRVSASADRAEQAEAIDVDTRRAKVALGELDPKNSQVAREVASIAEELGRSSAQVALNWVLQKPGVTSALFGCRKPEQLHDVLAALDFTLGEDAMGRLDELSKVDLGFPQRWGGGHFLTDGGTKIVSSW